MSTGRHAAKRAAEEQEQLLQEQQQILKKEEVKKAQMEKGIESQRIATMRTRFGGQVPDTEAIGASSGGTQGGRANNPFVNKFTTPSKFTGGVNPMKNTLMGMFLDPQQTGK